MTHPGAGGKTRVMPQTLRPTPRRAQLWQAIQHSQIGANDVNSLTTSAFDLSDDLTHKADPRLIAG